MESARWRLLQAEAQRSSRARQARGQPQAAMQGQAEQRDVARPRQSSGGSGIQWSGRPADLAVAHDERGIALKHRLRGLAHRQQHLWQETEAAEIRERLRGASNTGQKSSGSAPASCRPRTTRISAPENSVQPGSSVRVRGWPACCMAPELPRPAEGSGGRRRVGGGERLGSLTAAGSFDRSVARRDRCLTDRFTGLTSVREASLSASGAAGVPGGCAG